MDYDRNWPAQAFGRLMKLSTPTLLRQVPGSRALSDASLATNDASQEVVCDQESVRTAWQPRASLDTRATAEHLGCARRQSTPPFDAESTSMAAGTESEASLCPTDVQANFREDKP